MLLKTKNADMELESPVELQRLINEEVSKYRNARGFVR